MNSKEELFLDVLNYMGFELKHFEGDEKQSTYRIIDRQGGWEDKFANDAKGVVEELETVITDYFIEDLRTTLYEQEDDDVVFPKDYKEWANYLEENPEFVELIKKTMTREVIDLLANHLDEVNLDEVISFSNSFSNLEKEKSSLKKEFAKNKEEIER